MKLERRYSKLVKKYRDLVSEVNLDLIIEQTIGKFDLYNEHEDSDYRTMIKSPVFDYCEISIPSFDLMGADEKINLQGTFDGLITCEVIRQYQSISNWEERIRRDTGHIYNIAHGWYLTSILDLENVELGFFESIERDLDDFKDDLTIFYFQQFLENMVALRKTGNLVNCSSSELYEKLFDKTPPQDAIATLCRIHMDRVIKDASSQKENIAEPLGFGHFQVIPVEAIGYYGLVKKVLGIKLDYTGTIAQPYIEASFEKTVKDETCLYMIEKMSERSGINLLKNVLG